MTTASPEVQRKQARLLLDSATLSAALEEELANLPKDTRLPSPIPVFICFGVGFLLAIGLAFFVYRYAQQGHRYAAALTRIGQLEDQLTKAPPEERPRILGQIHHEVVTAGVPGMSIKGEPGVTGTVGAASTVPGPKGDTGAASTVPGPKGEKGDKGDTVIVPSPFPVFVPGPTVTISPPPPEPTPTPTLITPTSTATFGSGPMPTPTLTPAAQIQCLVVCPPLP